MKLCIFLLIFAVSNLAVSSQTCPSDHFPAVFVGILDKVSSDEPTFGPNDPELNYFKTVLNFRDDAIQHTIEDAIKFFNDTYGLDFSISAPNNMNERFFENATMAPYRFSEKHNEFRVITNNWIRTGSTRSTCNRIRHGGFRVRFLSDQTLYGSYGGAEGKPAGLTARLFYGIYSIDACQQSPVIIQMQSNTPLRPEQVDGYRIFNADLYSRVLGHGRLLGVSKITPVPEDPGQYHFAISHTFMFPAQ